MKSQLSWYVVQRLGNVLQRHRDMIYNINDEREYQLLFNEIEALNVTLEFIQNEGLKGDPPGRTLNESELEFCQAHNYEIGYDVDDTRMTEFQYHHICYPYEDHKGTICQSPNLWGHGSVVHAEDWISCVPCLEKLQEQMKA